MKIKSLTSVFVSLFLLGCSADSIRDPSSANHTSHPDSELESASSASREALPSLENLSDPDVLNSLDTSDSKTLPESKIHAIEECEYKYVDLCTWYEVPDAIIMGTIISAKKSPMYYSDPFGKPAEGVIDSCPSDSSLSPSLQIEIEAKIKIKSPTGKDLEYEDNNFVVLIDSFTLSTWPKEDRISIGEQIENNDPYVLKGIIEKGQTIGVTLFEFGDVWTISETPLFLLEQHESHHYYIEFQNVVRCASLTPKNYESIALDLFISSINKCDGGSITTHPEISRYHRTRMDKDGFGMNKCR